MCSPSMENTAAVAPTGLTTTVSQALGALALVPSADWTQDMLVARVTSVWADDFAESSSAGDSTPPPDELVLRTSP
jgi:hypothetical protein